MENDRLSHMCELLKKGFDGLAKKLSCAVQTLQQTVLELNEETNKNTKINQICNVQRKQIACFIEQLDITNRIYQDVVLESNEQKLCAASGNLDRDICKNRELKKKNGRLEDECVVMKCDKITAKLCNTEQQLHDTVSELRYKSSMKEKFFEENDRLKRESACPGKKLSFARQRLQPTVSKLHEEICLKDKINEELIKPKEEYLCVCENSEKTTRQLASTEQNLRDTMSKVTKKSCKRRNLNKQNDSLTQEYVLLNRVLDDMAEKVHCMKQQLQQIVCKLNEEISVKNKIIVKRQRLPELKKHDTKAKGCRVGNDM